MSRGGDPVDNSASISSLGLRDGHMFFVKLSEDPAPAGPSAATGAGAASSTAAAESSGRAGDASAAAAPGIKMHRRIGKGGKVEMVPEAAPAAPSAPAAPQAASGAGADAPPAGPSSSAPPAPSDAAFRPGMKSLRAIKKHWTLTEMTDLQKALEFKIQHQKEADCKKLWLDAEAAAGFVAYAQGLAFQQRRFAHLLGFFTDDDEAVAVALYEPPQEGSSEQLVLLPDHRGAAVGRTSDLLGMQRIGVAFTHPPREADGMPFTGEELCLCARARVEAGSPAGFVVARVTVETAAPRAGQAHLDAFQLSRQCDVMFRKGAIRPVAASEMQAARAEAERAQAEREEEERKRALRGAAGAADSASQGKKKGELEVNRAPEYCVQMDSRFKAIVEGKYSERVPVGYLIKPIAVAQETYFLHSRFPVAARKAAQGASVGLPDLRRHLKGKTGEALVEALRDFEALVCLAGTDVGPEVLPDLCDSVLDPDRPLEEGHELLVRTVLES